MKQQQASSGEQRRMNDSTLPPSSRAAGDTTLPAPKPSSAAASRRRKTGLRKGFGLSDWVTLTRASKDLAQRKGQGLRKITREEIRQHSSVHDGWISLHGKVYNIGPYLHYHPGGVDIFKPCLGRDATKLFEKYHQWVNADGLVGALLLGYLDDSRKSDDDDTRNYLPKNMTEDGFAIPAPRPPKAPMPSVLSSKNDDDEEEEDLNPWEKKE